MIVVSVCLPSDAFFQYLPSYLGFSYLDVGYLFMAAPAKHEGTITSWQIDGETVGKVADFISMGSKITADGDCSHEIKRHLLLGRKVMTNLDSI